MPFNHRLPYVADDVPADFRPTGLLIDLDGTLIDRKGRMSARVAQAVKDAAQRVPVAIASGREPDDVSYFARLLGLICPQVADNGARIVDPASGRTVHESPMPAAEARRIVGELEQRGLRYYAVDSGRVARTVQEFSRWRVTVICAHAVERHVCETLIAGLTSELVGAVPSTDAGGGYWYANFTLAGVSKGSGARYFSEATGAAMPGIVAVGDSHNDLPMFAEAGLAVAMGHAKAEVKSAARAVVGSLKQDGLAEAIERYVLSRL